mgnify:FL=1
MSRIKEITVADLSRHILDEERFDLVDIRTPAEIERGVLPGAKTLSMHLVPLRLDFFTESQKQVVIYCRTGSRSAQVCRFLNQQGVYNVISLRGGVVKWASGGLPLDPEPAGIIA